MENFLEQRLDGKGLEKLEKASLADVVKFTLGLRIDKAKNGMKDEDTPGYMIFLGKYFTESQRDSLENSGSELRREINTVKEIVYQKYTHEVNTFAKRNLGCAFYAIGVTAAFFAVKDPFLAIGLLLLMPYATLKIDRDFRSNINEVRRALDSKIKALEEEAHRINLIDVIKKDESYFKQKIEEYDAIE
jgi:hypothetical protein